MSEQHENNEEFKKNTEDYNDQDDDFEMECSDEEMRTKDGKEWEPTPEEFLEMYEKIDKERVLQLEWTTPGRRPPTPAAKFDSLSEEDSTKENISEEKSDFDFQDEMSSLKISAKAIRPAGSDAGPRGSAKKKTVSLDAILSNMARHRKLDMMEDDDEDPLP